MTHYVVSGLTFDSMTAAVLAQIELNLEGEITLVQA